MANRLVRHYGHGHLHFITFTCYQRLPLLRSVRARNTRRLRRKLRKKGSLTQLRLPFRQAHDFLPQFWQPRFYDFNVWSQKKFVEKLHYMHMNPLKRKLVTHPRDWPWSSFSFYAKKELGLVRIDPVH